MYARRVRLDNATGLHVRPATLLMETASRYRATIEVLHENNAADAKSAISLMLLEAPSGAELLIQATGEDEVVAVDALVHLVQRQFGEDNGRQES
jgi:phosphotransferase system HPr (HPr) family protein